jgi:hypothetical protein
MNRKFKTPVLAATPRRLSSSGQLIGWGVFGGLVLIGFVFGVVIGYEARPIVVAKATSELPPSNSSPGPKAIEPKLDSILEPRKDPETPRRAEVARPGPQNPPKRKVPTKPESSRKEPEVATLPPRKTEPKPPVLRPVSFQKEVLPILRAHCLNCHGAGSGKPKADVNLTSIAAMRRSPGKILVPGKPQESDVYTSITERDMPDGGRPKPTERELATLRNWILSGAKERRIKPRKSQLEHR